MLFVLFQILLITMCIFKGTNGKDGADGGVGQPGAAVWNLCITNLFLLITCMLSRDRQDQVVHLDHLVLLVYQ